MRIWEKTPAARFEDAHLLGNGRLGATVYGGVPTEEILLNDDTLWSGQEGYTLNEAYYDNLLRAREMTLAGDVKGAYELINDVMPGAWGEAYMPLASFYLTVGQKDDRRNMALRRVLELGDDPVSDYSRSLSLDEACARVEYRRDGVRFTREVFVSCPRQIAAVKLTAESGPLHFALSADSKLRYTVKTRDGELSLLGVAPDHAEPSYTPAKPTLVYHDEAISDAIRFAACARVAETDGQVTTDGTRVYVRDASYAVVHIAAGTNYAGYKVPRDKDAQRVLDAQGQLLQQCAGMKYDELRAEHVADHQSLYNRVSLSLGEPITDGLPTSERLKMNAETLDDPSVSALALQYSRYLIIAGSRPGTQALNLQGIWNDRVSPPWSSNYTTNINVQMNYWPAETLALSDCHGPMMDLVRESADSGARTAKDYYHARGWVAHHNIDLWRMTTPCCEDASFFWWPFGGAWLAQHLWTHYEFTKDEDFLRETAYPIIRDASRFMLDFMVELDGELLTAPSTSPENKYILPGVTSYRSLINEVTPENRFSANKSAIGTITKGSTMDMTMIRELFINTRAAANILKIDDEILPQIDRAYERLTRYKIGKLGQLQEWYEDYEECTPGMGHVSHLYSVYPAGIINEKDAPEAFRAAEVSLMRRVLHGGMKDNWPGSWAMCLGARFHNRTLCGMLARSICENLSANMLVKGYIQLDAIQGLGAGIAEMLIQSHTGEIELLPAISYTWSTGSFTGFRARGGFIVDAQWDRGALTAAAIESPLGGNCALRAQGLKRVLDRGGHVVAEAIDGRAAFKTEPGAAYRAEF